MTDQDSTSHACDVDSRSTDSTSVDLRDANQLVGTHDIVMITLDTLRYDVAVAALEQGKTPTMAKRLPGGRWQKRHTPASFTFAAHQAFFAGFLPTPASPGPHRRLFASTFVGSETTNSHTYVFDEPDWISALRNVGYHSICIGGVGFFNKLNPLGQVLPGYFDESHWSPAFGVTAPDSTDQQVDFAIERLKQTSDRLRLLFINVSAMHQPNCHYVDGADHDDTATQLAALAYVDGVLSRLFAELGHDRPAFCIVCSDHGTAYGESGFQGHRLGHEVVWTVPYGHFEIGPQRQIQDQR